MEDRGVIRTYVLVSTSIPRFSKNSVCKNLPVSKDKPAGLFKSICRPIATPKFLSTPPGSPAIRATPMCASSNRMKITYYMKRVTCQAPSKSIGSPPSRIPYLASLLFPCLKPIKPVHHGTLTGLPNRPHIVKHLEQILGDQAASHPSRPKTGWRLPGSPSSPAQANPPPWRSP